MLLVRNPTGDEPDAAAQLVIMRAFASLNRMPVVDEIREKTLAVNSWAQAALTGKVERGEVDVILVADVGRLGQRPDPTRTLLVRFERLGVPVVAVSAADVLVGSG